MSAHKDHPDWIKLCNFAKDKSDEIVVGASVTPNNSFISLTVWVRDEDNIPLYEFLVKPLNLVLPFSVQRYPCSIT